MSSLAITAFGGLKGIVALRLKHFERLNSLPPNTIIAKENGQEKSRHLNHLRRLGSIIALVVISVTMTFELV